MNQILKCVVIDDEPLAADLISSYVERTPGLEMVGAFSNAQDAVKTIIEGEADVVFLDINIPQLNGLEFARIIPEYVSIVFVTAYDSYAVDSFKVNAAHYLLKPVSYDDFLQAVQRVNGLREGRRCATGAGRDYVIVKSEYKLVQIRVDDILYVEGLKDYVKIVLDGDKKSVMSLMNIKTFEMALPSDRFMRVHRSYIVNTDKIMVIERNRIVLGKASVPISESYKQVFADYVQRYLVSPTRNQD